MEKYRPAHAPRRGQCFFVAKRPSEIDRLGGSTENVYLVEPGRDLLRVDSAWIGAINNLVALRKADGERLNGEDAKEVQRNAEAYWSGDKHPNSYGFEYLTSTIKVVAER